MSDSINNDVGGLQPGSPEKVSGATETLPSDSTTGAGFSNANSLSYSSGDDSVNTDSNFVELDTPLSKPMGATEYLERLFSSRMERLQPIFADFNNSFASGDFDLSDTQTILMVFRGMLKDIKILHKAEEIKGIAFDRLKAHKNRAVIVKLVSEIMERKNSSYHNRGELSLKLQEYITAKQEFVSKITALVANNDNSKLSGKEKDDALKVLTGMIELEPSDFANKIKNSLWKDSDLIKEIIVIQSTLKSVRSEINRLQKYIASVEGKNIVDETRVASLLLSLSLSINEEVLKSYKSIKQETPDSDSKRRSERKIDELKHELKLYEVSLSQDNIRNNLVERYIQEKRQKISGNTSPKSAVVHDNGSELDNKHELIDKNVALYMSLSVDIPNETTEIADPSEQQTKDTLEALSLIVNADPSTEEKQVEQPERSNIFSDVSEKFTLEQMDDLLNQLNFDFQHWQSGVNPHLSNKNMASDLLENQHNVDVMVSDALQDAELAEMTIRNRPV